MMMLALPADDKDDNEDDENANHDDNDSKTVQSLTSIGCFSSPSDLIGESTKVEPFATFQNTTRLVMTITIF